MELTVRDALTGGVLRLTVEAGAVTAVGPAPDAAGLPWVAPGFFDLQVNGAHGVAFGGPGLTPDGVRRVADTLRAHGAAGFLATVITGDEAAVTRGLHTLAAALDADSELAAVIPGVHLEGPHVSPVDGYRGAHPVEHVRPPDFDLFRRLNDASGGRVRLVTLAPEWPGAAAFITRLVRHGVRVSLGHTAADAAMIGAAADAGATLSTHLGNGLAATIDRHRNPVWPQLADDRLTAAVIADGAHVPAEFLRVVARVKTPARLVLTSDASPLAGCAPGAYDLWGKPVEVGPDGTVRLAGTPYLAGSGHFPDRCVEHMANAGGLTLADAVTAASVTPRGLLGLPVPILRPGARWAGFTVFDWHPGGPLAVRLEPGPAGG